MEGVVQGWEHESGRIRVQVQSEVVQVWPGELVRMQEQQKGQSSGERKRRTLEEPDTAAARANDEVKRARSRGVREPGASARSTAPDNPKANFGNLINSVTSEGNRGNKRGGGRSGVFARVASGLNVALRESGSGQYRGQVAGCPGEQSSKEEKG